MEFLQEYSVALKLFLAFASVVITIVLLYFNLRANDIAQKAVEQLKKAREEENRPYVFLDVEIKRYEMEFILRNHGRSAALDVQMTLDQPIQVWSGLVPKNDYTFPDMALSQGVPMIVPSDEVREWVDVAGFFFRNNEGIEKVTGKVVYNDARGKSYTHNIELNLSVYREIRQHGHDDIPELIKALEKIKRHYDRM